MVCPLVVYTSGFWLQLSAYRMCPKLSSGNETRSLPMEEANRRLMFHGMCLFLLGLLTGFAEQHFANVRMGLAAHLEGVMNGTFLIALGSIWPHVRLSPPATMIAFWTVLYGTYVNWLITLLAAAFGTAALSPITGAGHSGQPWQESVVMIGFMSVGIAIVASSALVAWGLRKKVSG
jgi:(hydroxyamino)benzene mutase